MRRLGAWWLVLAACTSLDGGGLRCVMERTTTDRYHGLGVCYTVNVHAVLKGVDGRVFTPSYHGMDTTDAGTHFWTDVYLKDRIAPGVYIVEVRRCAVGCLVEYPVRVGEAESPVLTIVCL